jgi:hypothetical protein
MHVNHQAKGQGDSLLVRNLEIAVTLIYSFVDVIAQAVLVRRKPQKTLDLPLILLTQICRCWEVWNRKLSVVVVPSILALISLGKSKICLQTVSLRLTQVEGGILTVVGEMATPPQDAGGWFTPIGFPIGLASLSVSLALNAILTGLLVFKIAKASLVLRHSHARVMPDITYLISIIVESGLVLFMAQLVLLLCFSTEGTAFNVTSGAIGMIYVRAYIHLPRLSFNEF